MSAYLSLGLPILPGLWSSLVWRVDGDDMRMVLLYGTMRNFWDDLTFVAVVAWMQCGTSRNKLSKDILVSSCSGCCWAYHR